MIKKIDAEIWKEAKFPSSLKKKYAISNKGRLASYKEDLIKDGTLLNGSLQEGYKIMRYNVYSSNGKKYEYVFFHTLVAKYFCKQKSSKHNRIIFKDFNRKNISANNLKWVTPEEQYTHSISSPQYIKASKKLRKPTEGPNLNAEKVKKIKRDLKQGKTLKELAKKFKVSDMQIHRIKSGENWGHIKA
jgi:hypothetical protein